MQDNPIANAEYHHLNKQIQDHRKARLRNIIIGVVLCAGAGLWVTTQVFPVGGLNITPSIREIYLVALFTVIVIGIHFIVIFRTLGMAAETFSREKREGRWEALLLTPVTARELVAGKCLGVIRAVWKDYVPLAILRAITVIMIGVFVFREQAFSLFLVQTDPVATTLPEIVMAVVFAVAFTVTNLVVTVIAGVTGSLVNSGTSPSMSSGMVVRMAAILTPVVLLTPIVFYLFREPFLEFDATYYAAVFVAGIQMVLIDNGMITTGYLANPYDPQGGLYIFIMFTTICVYLLIAWALYHIARYLVYRQGASA